MKAPLRTALISSLRPTLQKHPRTQQLLRNLNTGFDTWKHSTAKHIPSLIRPEVKGIKIAVTASCKNHCMGCRYWQDFMHGEQLSLDEVKGIMDDAKKMRMTSIMLYGGEPLLNSDLAGMIAYGNEIGLSVIVVTNGLFLKQEIDKLYEAGLRTFAISLFGIGDAYDTYVQVPGNFAKLEEGLAYTRERYGMGVNIAAVWLLSRPTCNPKAVEDLFAFVEKHGIISLGFNLAHREFIYFSNGPDDQLILDERHRDQIDEVVAMFIERKREQPELLAQSLAGLRSIPDWVISGGQLDVPCTAYQSLWIGADGSVHVCQMGPSLGNIREKPLRDIVYTPEHRQVARCAFQLDCPKCNQSYDYRVRVHAPSRATYAM